MAGSDLHGVDMLLIADRQIIEAGDDVSGGRLGMLDRVLWDSEGWPYIENYVPSSSSLVPVFNVQ